MKCLDKYRFIWIISLFPIISFFIMLPIVAAPSYKYGYFEIIKRIMRWLNGQLCNSGDSGVIIRYAPYSPIYTIFRKSVLFVCLFYQVYYYFKSSQWVIVPKNFKQFQISDNNNPDEIGLKISLFPYISILLTKVSLSIPILNNIVIIDIFGFAPFELLKFFIFVLPYVFSCLFIVPIFIFHTIYINSKILYRIKYRVFAEYFDSNSLEYYTDTEEPSLPIPKWAAILFFIVLGTLSFIMMIV